MKSLAILLLLAAQAHAGIISGGSGTGGGSSSATGISTGAATTAALTGDGNITNPLGVNSSSVAVYNANRNLAVPYGVIAATASFSWLISGAGSMRLDGAAGVRASSFTATYGLNASTAVITYIQVSSITATAPFVSASPDGGAAAPHYTFGGDTNTGLYHITTDRVGLAAGGVSVFDANSVGVFNMSAPTGQNAELTLYGGLGFGVGGAQGVVFNDGTVRTGSFQSSAGSMIFDSYRGGARFRTSSSGSPIDAIMIDTAQQVTVQQSLTAAYGVNSSSLSVAGSTFTVANTGIVSAPSQPGARADTLSLAVAGQIQRAVFFQLYWTNSSGNGSYNKNNVFKYDGASSDSFKARGAGVYFVKCQLGTIQNTGTNNTLKIYAMVNGTVVSEKMSVPLASANWGADLTDFLLLADGDVVTFKVYSDDTTNNPTVSNTNVSNFAIVQKVW